MPGYADKLLHLKGTSLLLLITGNLRAAPPPCVSKDKVLVKALWEDYDLHMEWAIKTAHLYPEIIGGKQFIKDKEVMKKFRSLIKNKLTFPSHIWGTKQSHCSLFKYT